MIQYARSQPQIVLCGPESSRDFFQGYPHVLNKRPATSKADVFWNAGFLALSAITLTGYGKTTLPSNYALRSFRVCASSESDFLFDDPR